MKKGVIIFLTIFIYSCNNDDSKLELLQSENRLLRDSIKILKKANPNFWYQSRVVAKSSEIKLGQEYMAEAFVSVIDYTNHPRVIFCNVKDQKLIPTHDTLIYNGAQEVSIYKTIPKDTGTFQWGGIILVPKGDEVHEYPFIVSYHVSK